MNLGTIIALITGLIPIAQKIGKIWETSGGFDRIAQLITGVGPSLAEIGAQMFPQAEKSVQAVLAAIHLGYPDSTKWVQRALNAGQSLGFIDFGAPLVVDGKFGPKTMAAVEALQTKLGVKATGAVQSAEYAALNLLLAGKLPA